MVRLDLRVLKLQKLTSLETKKKSLKISEAIQEVVKQALEQDRLVQGILDVTAQLHRCPREVLFVVLEQAERFENERKIQEKLVQAYCVENGVKLIKVNQCMKLLQSCLRIDSKGNLNTDIDIHVSTSATLRGDLCDPVKCILVRRPQILSGEELFVSAFHDTLVANNLTQFPFVRL